MRDRAAALGGSLTIRSAPGQGTTVTADRARTAADRAPGPHAHEPGTITVLIADDHPVVRQGLQVLLSVQDDIEVVGRGGRRRRRPSGWPPSSQPDVLLLDLKLPGLDGVGVLRELRDRGAAGSGPWC